MSPLLLLLTHFAVAAAAWFAGRWWAIRHLRIREIDGHAALELHHHDDGTTMTDTPPAARRSHPSTWLVVVLIASVLVITIGVSAFLDNRRRDAQAAADQRQRDCIIAFTNQLANTYAARGAAATRLEVAQTAKDRAQDHVFLVVFDARAVPPRATPKDFDRALARLVRAQRHLNHVKRQVAKVREQHPLPQLRKAKRCLR